jgi:phosphoglycerate dehydrogenase-like enzyme
VETVLIRSEAEALTHIPEAEAYYGRPSPSVLAAAKRLRWIQAPSAGLDHYFYPELREHPATVTSMRGIYSDVIADHVCAYILSFARGMHHYVRRQVEGVWQRGAPVIHLGGTTLGIVGLGGIGLEVAKRGHAFGMRIVAVDPAPKARPDYVEAIHDPEALLTVLAESDFVVICTPHTGETEYMIDGAALETVRSTAVLVNVGRGKVVDLEALTWALQEGAIGGAGLDVFEIEPLPEGHPLWEMDNVMITPHLAGVSPEVEGRRMGTIVENVRRFKNGEPLLNVVDKARGYVVEPNP